MKQDFSAAAPLFAKAFPLPQPANGNQPAALFFGTGLVTPKALSEELPFDFLSLIAAAEALRQERMNGRDSTIIHYIPDVTALQNDFMTPEMVAEKGREIEAAARKIADHLGLGDSYQIIRGSAIANDPKRLALLDETRAYAATADVPDQFKGYLAEQLADMAYFRQVYNGQVKLSWTMARNPQNAGKGLDESFFDAHFTRCFPGLTLDCAYIQPGRRLDGKANRACPYTKVPGEPRLSLKATFSLAATIEQSGQAPDGDTVRDAVKYWTGIVDALEQGFALQGLPQTPADRIDALRARLGF